MILLALLAAFVSSTLASSIIVSPLNKLVKHVGKIRDTEDKSKLEGKDLKIRARDEIGMLSETVNDMTHGLVDAAKASKNLTLGKEIHVRPVHPPCCGCLRRSQGGVPGCLPLSRYPLRCRGIADLLSWNLKSGRPETGVP